jgi:hypothetical protein
LEPHHHSYGAASIYRGFTFTILPQKSSLRTEPSKGGISMKTLFSIALLSLLLCAIFASAPPSTHASGTWVDDLLECTENYIYGRNDVWNTWLNSPKGPEDESQLFYGLDQTFDNFQACNSVVNVPYVEIDFCPAAQQAYYNCGVQFPGFSDSNARMECQLATHYDGTCQ